MTGRKDNCDHVWIKTSTWRWSEPTPSGGNRENWEGAKYRCTLCGARDVRENGRFLGFTRNR